MKKEEKENKINTNEEYLSVSSLLSQKYEDDENLIFNIAKNNLKSPFEEYGNRFKGKLTSETAYRFFLSIGDIVNEYLKTLESNKYNKNINIHKENYHIIIFNIVFIVDNSIKENEIILSDSEGIEIIYKVEKGEK